MAGKYAVWNSYENTYPFSSNSLEVCRDWVQVWSEETEGYSPPLKITQICEDGTVHLMTEDSEYCSPWKENIKNIDAIPIDADLLRGFGFRETSSEDEFVYGDCNFSYNIRYQRLSHMYWSSAEYFHEMQNILSKKYNINFEWKGNEK